MSAKEIQSFNDLMKVKDHYWFFLSRFKLSLKFTVKTRLLLIIYNDRLFHF
jgi:hypothetical protein